METLKARMACADILQTLRIHRCQPRQNYTRELSITIGGESKLFNDQSKYKQLLSTSSAPQLALEAKLQSKESNHTQEYTRLNKSITVYQNMGDPSCNNRNQ